MFAEPRGCGRKRVNTKLSRTLETVDRFEIGLQFAGDEFSNLRFFGSSNA